MERLLAAADRAAGPSTASPPPTTTGCAPRSAEEVERRYAPGEPLAGVHAAPRRSGRLVAEHRRGRADHKSILYCLLELSEWHHAFVEARQPVAA